MPSVEEAEQDAAEKEQDALKLDQGNLGMAWQAGSLEAEQDVAEKNLLNSDRIPTNKQPTPLEVFVIQEKHDTC